MRGNELYSIENEKQVRLKGAPDASYNYYCYFNSKELIIMNKTELVKKDERTGRNPATGEDMTFAASNTPVLKPAKAFKEKVN